MNLSNWLDQYLTANPPRAKSLVMTLFGDVITPHGGQVWLGSLIELLALFGVNDRLVRTSVYRLTDEGWLDAQREGRRSRYTLNPRSAARFKRAYQTIYTPAQRDWNGRWTLVFTAANIITVEQRSDLRRELLWQGFALVAPHILAHPTADLETLNEILERNEARDSIFVCTASEEDTVVATPMNKLVEQCWDLNDVIKGYQQLIADFESLPDLLSNASASPQDAFMARALIVHAFRRAMLHDPQLPLQLLPSDWPGTIAYELCRQIYYSTWRGAEQHIQDTLRKEEPESGTVADYFFDRFGGLD